MSYRLGRQHCEREGQKNFNPGYQMSNPPQESTIAVSGNKCNGAPSPTYTEPKSQRYKCNNGTGIYRAKIRIRGYNSAEHKEMKQDSAAQKRHLEPERMAAQVLFGCG